MTRGGLLRSGPSNRVGIVLLTGIGDVVHGLPLANDLKRDDPSREVVWIAEPAPAEVLRHHPAVDHVVVYRKGEGIRGVRRLRRDLAHLRCDLLINLIRYAKGLPGAVFSGAPRSRRICLPRTMTRDGVHLFHGHRLPDQPWCHTQDLFLKMREPLGLPTDARVEWKLRSTGEERELHGELVESLRLQAAGRPLVGVVLETANSAKDWTEEGYAALCRELLETGRLPILIASPFGRGAEIAERLRKDRPEIATTVGRDVRTMIRLIEIFDLVVSPDTGPLHIAHALGTPVVGLFGHTNPWRVGPWRDFQELVVDRYNEPGAQRDPSLYDPKDGRMEQITPDEVMTRVELGLAGAPSPAPSPEEVA